MTLIYSMTGNSSKRNEIIISRVRHKPAIADITIL
jgi:hypothetical protein